MRGLKTHSVDLVVTSPPFGLVRKKEKDKTVLAHKVGKHFLRRLTGCDARAKDTFG